MNKFWLEYLVFFEFLGGISLLGMLFVTLTTFILSRILQNSPNTKIEKNFPGEKQSKFEFWQQLKSVFLSIFVGYGAVFWLIWQNYSKIYYHFNFSIWSLIWFLASFPLMILLADLYIYAIHRTLHASVFWQIHRIHHKSVRVNVFSSYSLDILESVLYTLFLGIFITIFPTHIINFLTFMTLTVIYNFYIHSGHEFLPPVFIFLNTASLHQVHHTKHDYNFAFYTNIWDRIFGTFKPFDNRNLVNNENKITQINPKKIMEKK
jgi:Delta7-sterol 5-desaturase